MKTDLKKLVRAERKALGLNGKSQQDLLRKLRDRFELTNEQLAEALGYSNATLLAYLAAEGTAMYRRMPEADRLVIARILAKRK